MISLFIASYASLLPGQLSSSCKLTELIFHVSLLSRVGGWLVGWLGGVELKLKLNSAQLKLELGLSLAIIIIFKYSLFCSRPAMKALILIHHHHWRMRAKVFYSRTKMSNFIWQKKNPRGNPSQDCPIPMAGCYHVQRIFNHLLLWWKSAELWYSLTADHCITSYSVYVAFATSFRILEQFSHHKFLFIHYIQNKIQIMTLPSSSFPVQLSLISQIFQISLFYILVQGRLFCSLLIFLLGRDSHSKGG